MIRIAVSLIFYTYYNAVFNPHTRDTHKMRETRKENLKRLLVSVGSIAALNEKIGRRRLDPYLYAVLSDQKNKSGSIRGVGSKLCADIERAFDLPAGWMNISHDNQPPQTQTPPPAPIIPQPTPEQCANCISIPLLACAKRTNKTCIYLEREDIGQYFPDQPLENFRAVVIHSDDLAPEFKIGDRVLIDITDNLPDYGVFALSVNERTIMRRLAVSLDGGLFLYADKYPNQAVPFDAAKHKVIGRAVYHWRGTKL